MSETQPGIYIRQGTNNGFYYGKAHAVNLRTGEVTPYNQSPVSPIDADALSGDILRAQQYMYPPQPKEKPDQFGFLGFAAVALIIFFFFRLFQAHGTDRLGLDS